TLLALSTAVSARAADSSSATGTIEGRVFNARNGTTIENARVSIDGTSLITFTDADGNFQLTHVPAGSARMRVFFTGLTPQTAEVTVVASVTVQRDITLAAAKGDALTPMDEKAIKLDEFVVSMSREMDAAAIAINEQRFAPNLKNVASTDEFGAVNEG